MGDDVALGGSIYTNAAVSQCVSTSQLPQLERHISYRIIVLQRPRNRLPAQCFVGDRRPCSLPLRLIDTRQLLCPASAPRGRATILTLFIVSFKSSVVGGVERLGRDERRSRADPLDLRSA